MPGVGITDAQRILDLVSEHRSQVAVSAALQLLSAACYAPALAGLVAQPGMRSDRHVLWAAILLLIGAMGSSADAVFHVLAHAMTYPGMDRASLVPLMQIVQGAGLVFVLPLIASFFVGSLWLSIALARRRLVSPWNPGLYGLALAIGILGGILAPEAGSAGRSIALAVLAVVAVAQGWLGAALRAGQRKELGA
jgi:hypothetical protein